jgi:hypothetical protein
VVVSIPEAVAVAVFDAVLVDVEVLATLVRTDAVEVFVLV